MRMQVVLVYLQPFLRNSLLKCAPQNRKKLTNAPIFGVRCHGFWYARKL